MTAHPIFIFHSNGKHIPAWSFILLELYFILALLVPVNGLVPLCPVGVHVETSPTMVDVTQLVFLGPAWAQADPGPGCTARGGGAVSGREVGWGAMHAQVSHSHVASPDAPSSQDTTKP